ncbi:MAG: hypothetical protein IJ615_02480 [Bacteroidaceae bacterium]|nr:hypothetical protein [Bacteroidaceae bacterium]
MKKNLLALMLMLVCMGAGGQNPDSLTFAVLGNSISTYYDYIPAGYAVYYDQNREKNNGIQVGDTWWMQLSRLSGLTFLANASWSGSRVAADELNSNAPFLSNHRMKALGRAGKPDFIFIAGGTNDWNVARVPLGEYRTENFTDSVTFRGAYQRLLYKLTTWYPQARIVCLSIFPRGNGISEKNAKGWSQADANASIRYIANQFGQYYVDCSTIPFSNDWGAYTLDRLHPTTLGATQIATCINNALIRQKLITKDLKRSGEVEEAERLLDLRFTADGIVNLGTFETRIGKHGAAATFYDAAGDVYYGCSKARASDFFYATYDEGSPLAEAFNSSVTWEMLVRPDGLADQSGGIARSCILGNEQDGGWAFYSSAVASCFSYRHNSGVSSTMKSITGDSILIPGKFYHIVATMDRPSHTMRYYINGKLVCTGTRAGTDMPLPQCGTQKGRKGMWICLGGDATSASYNGSAEASTACSFVFARIYDGALTQKAALKLYDDEVRKFTEPQASLGTELIMDCEFTPEGAVNHAPSYRDRPIAMVGEVPMRYNADINLYEAQFSATKTQFFKYMLGDAPSAMSQLSDAYSVEVYCRNNNALPKAITRPLGLVNTYGFGIQMNTKGNIGYTTVTQGNKADGSYSKTQWMWAQDATLTTDYTHYVIVYDRKHYTSRFYINGKLADQRWLTFKECPVYEWTPSTWLAIGGDAHGNYEPSATGTTGSYPFDGDVAMVRIYGRALSDSEVQTLDGILHTSEVSYKFGANGYAAVCLPYAWRVPEDCTAFIVTEIASPSVILTPVAQAGECVPYGTPVLLKGTAKATVTLTALDKSEVYSLPEATDSDQSSTSSLPNLLTGTYPGRTLLAGEGYYIRTTGANIYRTTTSTALPPFSCYLVSSERRSYFKIEESADGLDFTLHGVTDDTARREQANGTWFDFTGRRVSVGQHAAGQVPLKSGLYIRGGRKVIISK